MGTELTAPAPSRPIPDRIGPYVILGRLGAGAMGQVYLGRSAAGRLVAVKTIKAERAEEAGFRMRFVQEVEAARRVSGTFTAAVVAADPVADMPWMATAYVPAPSLSRLVQACGPLPARTVRWLAATCAEALESIHAAGLVHRDLKPSNVLVTPDGLRVIDFGVARASEVVDSTGRGAVGTPAYMAPEQVKDTKLVSAASDVYSLGATLLFAATGHHLYDGDSVTDVLTQVTRQEPDLSSLAIELTPLIGACLRRDPLTRPTTAAMLARLGRFIEPQQASRGGHSYLPEPAMALIAEYQRSPQFTGSAQAGEESGDDATVSSLTELPASYASSPAKATPGGQLVRHEGRKAVAPGGVRAGRLPLYGEYRHSGVPSEPGTFCLQHRADWLGYARTHSRNWPDAEDAVSHAMQKVVEHHTRHGTLCPGGRDPATWPKTVIRNYLTGRYRRISDDTRTETAVPPAGDVADDVLNQIIAKKALAFVASLNPQDHMIATMNLVGDLKPSEIASRLGITPSSVRSSLHRTQKKVRKNLGIAELRNIQPERPT